MKKLKIFGFMLAFSILHLSANAQDEGYLFRKNSSFFKFNQGLDIGRYSWTENGDDDGTQNLADLNFEMTYFVADHIGLGVWVNADRSRDVYDYLTDISTNYMIYGSGMYGTEINDEINLYGKLKIGFGADKYHTEYSGGNEESETENKFGWGLEVGAPVRLFNSPYFYFTPAIAFRSVYTNFDGGKETRTGLWLSGSFDIALDCDRILWDYENDYQNSLGKYSRGNAFVGAAFASAGFGNEKTEYEGEPGSDGFTSEDGFSNGKLGIRGSYFVVDYLAIGAEIGINRNGTNDKSSDYSQTTTTIDFSPIVIGHIPETGALGNLYALLAGTFGSYTQNYENGSTSEYKENYFSIYGGAGYNLFFTDDLALSFELLLDFTKWNEKDGANEWTRLGPKLGIGMKKFFSL